ncbi:MAG: cofactor-independent phosphoglycerate mutase [bacterium]
MSAPPTLLVVPDGMADWPQEELDGKTPLQAARTPNLDRVTRAGRLYRLQNIPEECPADSGIANMALLGYDPRRYYLGRGALEALNLGENLQPGEVAFRCNLVTTDDENLVDYSAGNLSTEEARQLFETLQRELGGDDLRFCSGIRYRGLLISTDFKNMSCYPPHDEMGRRLEELWPEGSESEELVKLMKTSKEILSEHPVNEKRKNEGKKPANMIWPWGGGEMRQLPSIEESYGLAGNVIAGVDLINGLGIAVGMNREEVEGATGDYNTNMKGKARRALKVLDEDRLVFVHVEAPDEAGHEGDAPTKIRMIEKWDREVMGTLVELALQGEFRLALGPDHYTPLQKRTHVKNPVPFLILDDKPADDHDEFSESTAENAKLIRQGWAALADWYKQSNHPFD